MRHFMLAVSVLGLFVAGCGGGPDGPPRHREEEWHAPVQMLLKYVGPDGAVTRAQMEAGLRRDFGLADKNRSGVLEPDEARVVNQERWNEDKSAVSPLQDWNGDGAIDFAEFAAAARALFNELDRDHTGVLTPDILRAARGLGPDAGPAKPGGPPGGDPGGQGRRGPPGG